MSTITLRLPDSKHERLKEYAKSRGISLNRLFDELATVALSQHDARVRFELMASHGDRERGLALLEKLDRALAQPAESKE